MRMFPKQGNLNDSPFPYLTQGEVTNRAQVELFHVLWQPPVLRRRRRTWGLPGAPQPAPEFFLGLLDEVQGAACSPCWICY